MLEGTADHPVQKLREDVVVTVLEEGAVLLDLESKFFYSVNGVGWAIVQLLEGGATRGEVLERCRRWGSRQEDGESVSRFLETLAREGLVVEGGIAATSGEIEFSVQWSVPTIEKHKEPLQRIMVSAFDPSLPLAE